MTVLISAATGNFSAAGSWKTVDATTYLNSESGSTALNATNGSSSDITPGAITIDAIAVKLAVRTNTSGTVKVELVLSAGGASVAGTAVTINGSDLPIAAAADKQGGWIVFAFAAPVLLVAATAYKVKITTASSQNCTFYTDGTASNWSRMLRTTTTAAPSATNDLVVAGEHTGAGTGNSFVITMDNNSTTAFGNGATGIAGQVTPGLAICKRGSLVYNTGGATQLRISGNIVAYGQGTLTVGAVGTEIPRGTAAILEFPCAADGDFGLTARNESNINIVGLSRTSGKNVTWCLLAASASVNNTTLTVGAGDAGTASAADTGWKDNDVIAIASSVQFATAEQSEVGALNGDAVSGTLTVDSFAGAGGGVAFAHDGDATRVYTAADGQTYPYSMQCEIINLTRDIKIQSTVTTADAYFYMAKTAVIVIAWAEFNHMGGIGTVTTGTTGLEVETVSSAWTMTYCSIHDSRTHGISFGRGFLNPGCAGTFQHNVFWNNNTTNNAACYTVYVSGRTTNTMLLDDLVSIRTSGASGISGVNFYSGTSVPTWTNLRASSTGGWPFYCTGFLATETVPNSWGPFYFHSSRAVASIQFGNWAATTITKLVSYRNAGGPNMANGNSTLTIGTLLEWADGNFGFGFTSGGDVIINGGFIASDTTYTMLRGIWWDSIGCRLYASNLDLSPVQGILAKCTFDFQNNGGQSSPIQFTLNNCLSNGATRFSANPGNADLTEPAFVTFEKLGRVAGSNINYQRFGSVQTDAVIFNPVASGPSFRMTPTNGGTGGPATGKLLSAPKYSGRGFKVPVASGIPATVSITYRTSLSTDASGANYGGAAPRLIQLANAALITGTPADVVLATGSVVTDGAWRTLSGTTSTPNDNGEFEIIVDCDFAGAGGWVNFDVFVVVTGSAPYGTSQRYWYGGLPNAGATPSGGYIVKG